mmetsp:Transcript_19898/g.59267  ORF Transcript_19898/g.59267 Transcript_19898/m.59267 type:complete len:225 (+) Transcript_19898:147-821(+)
MWFLLSFALGAAASLTDEDIDRAVRRVPGAAFRGHDLAAANVRLNERLRARGQRFKACGAFSHDELRTVQRRLYELTNDTLLSVYPEHDGRAPRFSSLAELDAHHASFKAMDASADAGALRDGLCTEAVMMFVHHLSEAARRDLSETLPLLPEAHAPAETPVVAAETAAQLSCQQCHTGLVEEQWANATLPPPIENRGRVCDYQHVAARDAGLGARRVRSRNRA